MVTYATMTVPLGDRLLGDTVRKLSNCRVRIEQSVFDAGDGGIFVWITCDDPGAIESALSADESIGGFTFVEDRPDGGLFRLETDQYLRLLSKIIGLHDGTVMEAVAEDDLWRLQVRYRGRADLASADRSFEQYSLDVSYESIASTNDEEEEPGHRVLTESQRKGLETAHELGYYEIPRGQDLCEVAEELDVSHQAMSERLRRAEDRLVSDYLLKEPAESEDGVTLPRE